MLAWQDQGILLRVSPLAESHLIVDILSRHHGRWRGCVPRGRRLAGLQPGNQVQAAWQARLEDQLGRFTVDITQDIMSHVFLDRKALLLLNLMTLFLAGAVSERQPYERLYDVSVAFLTSLVASPCTEAYLRWELATLQELGFGIDLSQCVVTGSTENLSWVSPKSGGAVSQEGGRGYEAKLLALPPFFTKEKPPSPRELRQGTQLTGYFLTKHFSSLPFFPGWAEMRGRLIHMIPLC